MGGGFGGRKMIWQDSPRLSKFRTKFSPITAKPITPKSLPSEEETKDAILDSGRQLESGVREFKSIRSLESIEGSAEASLSPVEPFLHASSPDLRNV